LVILRNLSTKEVVRFNELKSYCLVLAVQYWQIELEREGFISKKIYPVPPKVEYCLTPSQRA
jgi:HxlR-like helix-turn-helix